MFNWVSKMQLLRGAWDDEAGYSQQAISRERVIEEEGLRAGLTGVSQATPSLAGPLLREPRGARSALASYSHRARKPPCETAAVQGIFQAKQGEA
ncbi:hypothetical protein NDU88_006605 [Pleurodeles waltl]|uniref:Uncharacterized protein n=1 Tax=Pleurodeles waltl TaxID=8319 RepID=A0AAV7QPF4_PLEWA|nr:hypothetical protein NDU88_006605 [Pleurodeles waltl]